MCRVGTFLGNTVVVTTEDGVRVSPFVGPRDLGGSVKPSVAWVDILSFCRVGNLLGNTAVVPTEDGVRVSPFVVPRDLGGSVKRSVALVDILSICRVGNLLGNTVTTEDGARVSPLTGPRVLEKARKLLVSGTVSSDAKPGVSVLVGWIAVVVNAPLSKVRRLVSGKGVNAG